ncbi:MAG: hypothetical protein JWN04_1201 [Myxococcaceae bacterium]|nr:hypothetical protein [Myxococcaceae bacterium]
MNYLGWILGLSLVLPLTGVACGGSAPKPASATGVAPVAERDEVIPEVHKHGAQKLIVVVGPAGGTLELDNGARLLIPQGSLNGAVEVTFAEGARTTAFSNHDYEKVIGPTLEIALDSDLLLPVELSIPDTKLPEGFSEKHLALGVEAPASTQRAIEGQAVATRWDYLDATSKEGRAVAQLPQVPGYRLQFLVSKSD